MLQALNTLLNVSRLAVSDGPLWIASWNGSTGSDGLKINASLSQMVTSQIKPDLATLFNDSFINYQYGIILCTNQPEDLNKFFTGSTSNSSTVAGANYSLKDNLRFTSVAMPAEFINKKSQLSSPYSLGERLRVVGSLEVQPSNATLPASIKSSQQPVVRGTQRQVIIFRDTNIKGRSVKGSGGGGGGSSVGVWS
jgi:hypothetical protein